MSRMMSRDHLSPNTSSARFMGHLDLWSTRTTALQLISKINCLRYHTIEAIVQLISKGEQFAAVASNRLGRQFGTTQRSRLLNQRLVSGADIKCRKQLSDRPRAAVAR